ncbi:hypothetical protein GGR54DRAFT_596857 [Hypoxylon sp. NC1633]|nr:hypothetical protein GGR54DRAFT_596857 [Hypoxylon sp. NC1633]
MGRIDSDQSSLNVPRPGIGGGRSSSPVAFGTYQDPRSSSTQSLLPSPFEDEDPGRRKLLVIYIHGFMGNDASFQSFPAHVHHYLKLALADTHAIHSKIYPRYKTYKAIDVARDNFSKWLAPHESPTTDVVLIGHSMGGLLGADVALMPSSNQYRPGYFLHRILGTLNLDVPFLGLHHSVITTGIASLFRPKSDVPKPLEEPIPENEASQSLSNVTSAGASIYSDPASTSQLSSPYPSPSGSLEPYSMTFDPNFNPSFNNDVRVQNRGWWKNIVHFVEKHSSEGLIDAASYHIMSHLEFGGCLLDANNLRTRYDNIRRLEDMDDIKHHGFPHVPPQVRFVQYYTVCHGYPKKPKGQDSNQKPENPETPGNASAAPSTPQIPGEGRADLATPQKLANAIPKDDPPDYTSNADNESLRSMELLAPEPMSEEPHLMSESEKLGQPLQDVKEKAPEHIMPATSPNDESSTDPKQGHENAQAQSSSSSNPAAATNLTETMASLTLDLPPIPELPPAPDVPDLNQYTDKDARKLAEKEAKRALKDYAKAVKDREKAIKDRQKIFDKRKKKLAQEAEKREKDEQKRLKKEASASLTSEAKISKDTSVADLDPNIVSPLPSPLDQSQSQAKPPKPPKERKFCNTPSKVDGQLDPKWVKIFMKDMDQVAAHTGLFFRGDHYERLIGDVGETIVSWVQDDMTKRAILELQETRR